MTGLIQRDLLQLEARTPPTIGASELGLYVDNSDGNKPKVRQGSNDYDLTQLLQLLSTNLIHNSSLDIWPEGTSFPAIATAAYAAEGWRVDYSTSGVVTVTRDTDVPTPSAGHDGFAKVNYSIKVDVTTADATVAAGDLFVISQRIEGYTFNAVAGRKMVVSIPFKTDRSGGATVCLSVVNSGLDRSWVKEFVVPAGVWTKLEMPIDPSPSAGTWDYTTGVGLTVRLTIMSGSTFQTTQNVWQTGNFLATANQSNGLDSTANNFWLCQPKLEPGDRATIFVPESYSENWLRCQRYFHKSVDDGFVVGSGANDFDFWVTEAWNAANADGIYRFPVSMRTTPTITLYSRNGTSGKTCASNNAAVDVGTTVTALNPSAKGIYRLTDSGAGLTAGATYLTALKATARL